MHKRNPAKSNVNYPALGINLKNAEMLYQSLKFIAEQLNIYLQEVKKPVEELPNELVILGNASSLEEDNQDSANNILLSLINIKEEITLKNDPAKVIAGAEHIRYNNPPVNLNLDLLFTLSINNYELALKYLSHTIAFFQGKKIFTRQNSYSESLSLPNDIRLIMDLHSLSLEQVNYLWSILGGKQKPFAYYKLRMVKIEKDSTLQTRGIITSINLTESGV